MELTFFERDGDVYRRFDESESQYIHKTKDVESALTAAGFSYRFFNEKFKNLRSVATDLSSLRKNNGRYKKIYAVRQDDSRQRDFRKGTCRQGDKIHSLSRTAAAALGRTLIVGAYMGTELKDDKQKLSITINGGGPLGRIVVLSDYGAKVRGYVENPAVELPLNEKGNSTWAAASAKTAISAS